mmetsp:Transcript_27353/g.88338  ORF Transcript_27353/g.88338 Transcript_27353/m.88338 type:complete len:310 (+) Transcript_27353:588-1517(+)
MVCDCFLSASRSTTSSSRSSSNSSSESPSSPSASRPSRKLLETGGSDGRSGWLLRAASPISRIIASSSSRIASMTMCSFLSHCRSTSVMLSSVSASRASSMATPSSRSARCWIPALTDTNTFASRSYLCRCRSCLRSVCPGAATCCPSSVDAEYFSRCTRSCASRFFFVSASSFCCDSLVSCCKFLCVASCVMNFSITSLTSATPVASLISLKAASYDAIFSSCSAMSASVMTTGPPGAGASALPCCAIVSDSRRARSRRSSSALASVFLATSARRSANSFSRSLRSSVTACSNLASSCLASSLDWFAS